MPSIADAIRAEADHAKIDLRKDAADLLAKLGVDTSDEHQVFHAVLLFVLKAVQAGVQAEVASVGA